MKILFKLSFMIMLVGFLASCGPKGEKAETGDAKEVEAATGKEYAVNTASSNIMWEGTKVTGSHNGTIGVSEGTINFDNGALTGGSFTIDMNSIKNLDMPEEKQANLVDHLKGTVEGKETDFFNTPKYPTAKFEITKATKLMNNEEGNYVVTGNLTLKEITKSVSFKAMVSEANGKVMVKTPKFTIDRTEWDIKYKSASFVEGLKDKAINDEIGLEINVTAG